MTFAARPLQNNAQKIGDIFFAVNDYPPAYAWFENGFGARYALPPYAPYVKNGSAINTAKNAVAYGRWDTDAYGSYNGPIVFRWSEAGYGTAYANASSYPEYASGESRDVALSFSPADDAMVVALNNYSPYVVAYKWSNTTGFGTKYSNPATLPGSSTSIAFSPTGNVVAVGKYVYKWTYASGFGTLYTIPASLTGTVQDARFSPDGTVLVLVTNTTPYIHAYQWTFASGYGTKYADPAVLPTGSSFSVSFSPAGDAIVVAHNVTPYVTAYAWNNTTGFGAKYANPSTLPAGNGLGTAFSDSGNYIAVAHSVSPVVSIYPWTSGGGFGTKLPDPNPALSSSLAIQKPVSWKGA